jgi:hypothetical protein
MTESILRNAAHILAISLLLPPSAATANTYVESAAEEIQLKPAPSTRVPDEAALKLVQ